jgi:hypothetical protein
MVESAKTSARDLAAYVFVYCAMAERESQKAAKTPMEGMGFLLHREQFAMGEPAQYPERRVGYSAAHRALWVRPVRAGSHHKDLLYENRTLIPKLRAFAGSLAFQAWQERPVDITHLLKPAQQEAYAEIGGSRAPKRVACRGAVLVGHDKDREGERGVFWIGLRDTHVERVQQPEEAQTFWLRQHPNTLERLGALPDGPWTPPPGILSLDAFHTAPGRFLPLCRALRTEFNGRWKDIFATAGLDDPGLRGRRPRTIFMNFEDDQSWEAHLTRLLTDPKLPANRWLREPSTIVLFSCQAFTAIESALPRLLRTSELNDIRLLVVDPEAVLRWVRHYPWTWATGFLSAAQGEQALARIAAHFLSSGQEEIAKYCAIAGLLMADRKSWEYDPFVELLWNADGQYIWEFVGAIAALTRALALPDDLRMLALNRLAFANAAEDDNPPSRTWRLRPTTRLTHEAIANELTAMKHLSRDLVSALQARLASSGNVRIAEDAT